MLSYNYETFVEMDDIVKFKDQSEEKEILYFISRYGTIMILSVINSLILSKIKLIYLNLASHCIWMIFTVIF